MRWHMSLFTAPGRQRQAGLSEFEVSLVYIVSFTTAKTIYRDPVSKTN